MDRGTLWVIQSMGWQTVGHDWATNTFTLQNYQGNRRVCQRMLRPPFNMWNKKTKLNVMLVSHSLSSRANCWPYKGLCLEGTWSARNCQIFMGQSFHFHALEKEMATHSSVLAWRIPGTGEPDGLLSMGSHRVRHDWSDLAAAASWLTSTAVHCYSGETVVD